MLENDRALENYSKAPKNNKLICKNFFKKLSNCSQLINIHPSFFLKKIMMVD